MYVCYIQYVYMYAYVYVGVSRDLVTNSYCTSHNFWPLQLGAPEYTDAILGTWRYTHSSIAVNNR